MTIRNPALWLAVVLVLAWPGLAPAQPAFETLPPAKALAVAVASPQSVRGLTHSQPHELAASVRAREQCQASAAPGQVCEVVRLNDQHITTGAEILARVPDQAHPLFLWRYRHADTVLYLAGSIHILKPSLYPLPRQLESAFQASDYLVLEVDVGSLRPEDLQRSTVAHAMLPDQQTLEDVLPKPLHRRVERHLAAFGMTPAMVNRAKPAMVMNQIVVSRLLTLGYLPDSGLETHFLRQRTDQEVLELESLEDQLALLFDQPMPTQIQLLAETLDVEGEIEPLLADMLAAWLSGDDVGFLEQFKAQSGDSPLARAFTRELLDDRNHKMVDGVRELLIESAADGPATYFVLVGAAHLVGEQGIVELLRTDGIEGERIMSNHDIAAEETGP